MATEELTHPAPEAAENAAQSDNVGLSHSLVFKSALQATACDLEVVCVLQTQPTPSS
ncbi:MAG: hypothetical protein HY978_04880 [Candidatus Liptonbacteria bacterium]|nr:hypothetical protein [Candidatus Liptonbacteria bacterium]